MRDRLIKLLCGIECEGEETFGNCPQRLDGQCRTVQKLEMCQIGAIADYLIENGVIVLPHKPINVMCIEDSTDVCCPYCETILSGLYGEEPTDIIQCYICGAFLDNTGAITREEAEQALKEVET